MITTRLSCVGVPRARGASNPNLDPDPNTRCACRGQGPPGPSPYCAVAHVSNAIYFCVQETWHCSRAG